MSEVPRDDFVPTASWDSLRRRAEIIAQVRGFFNSRGFLEVETPLLSADVVIDRHIDPFKTILAPDPTKPNEGRALWLQTSPESAMKRLMASGGEAIFQLTRSFRNGERGARHNPEFTILEWYRRGDDLDAGMALLDELCQAILNLGTARRTTYAEAFAQHWQLDPHAANVAELTQAANRADISTPAGFEAADRDAWLNLLLAERIEPQLGLDRPEMLYAYPASQAALAQLDPGPPPVAERFELYVRGIELANGYHELTSADALAAREPVENAGRTFDGKSPLPGAPRLIAAMQHGLPDCTGVALGVDRLVMLALGASSIDEVIPFPIERA